MEEKPDSYQYERANKFLVSQRCIGGTLRRLGISHKKTLVHPKANEEKRTMFKNRIAKYKEEGAPSFTQMKVDLHMICQEPTVIQL